MDEGLRPHFRDAGLSTRPRLVVPGEIHRGGAVQEGMPTAGPDPSSPYTDVGTPGHRGRNREARPGLDPGPNVAVQHEPGRGCKPRSRATVPGSDVCRP